MVVPVSAVIGNPARTRQVPVVALDAAELLNFIGSVRQAALQAAGDRAASALSGRVVMHVNSTATGGGVAEMLPTLLGYTAGFGIDVRWSVIRGDPAFFAITKRIHNRIHGYPGDDGALGLRERRAYETILDTAAQELRTWPSSARWCGACSTTPCWPGPWVSMPRVGRPISFPTSTSSAGRVC